MGKEIFKPETTINITKNEFDLVDSNFVKLYFKNFIVKGFYNENESYWIIRTLKNRIGKKNDSIIYFESLKIKIEKKIDAAGNCLYFAKALCNGFRFSRKTVNLYRLIPDLSIQSKKLLWLLDFSTYQKWLEDITDVEILNLKSKRRFLKMFSECRNVFDF